MNTARDLKDYFTYDEYAKWEDNERWELIGGSPRAMSPAPNIRHQRIVKRLAVAMEKSLEGKKCELMLSPCDLKLSAEDVLQPDLMVVCDPDQIKENYVEGPPTLVVEVLSPNSLSRDMLEKLQLYARFSIPEYWIVTPFPSFVTVYSLDGETYRAIGGANGDEVLTSPAFPKLEIDLTPIFDFPLTDEEKAIMQLRLCEPQTSRYGS